VLVAFTCLLAFVVTVCFRSADRKRPLDPNEVHRLRRFSEKLQREQSLPFE
jgi:hypothetical protein